MAKMSKLDAALTELSAHSQCVLEAVKTIRELLGTSEAENAPEQAAIREPITIEDVRAALLAKARAGFREDVKALLVRHGAETLPEIDPGEYHAMMEEATVIGV